MATRKARKTEASNVDILNNEAVIFQVGENAQVTDTRDVDGVETVFVSHDGKVFAFYTVDGAVFGTNTPLIAAPYNNADMSEEERDENNINHTIDTLVQLIEKENNPESEEESQAE